MRKVITVFSVIIFAFLYANQHASAEEAGPVLSGADIEITIDNNMYTIKEEIVLSGLKDEGVTHKTKEITENKISNITFTNGEGELTPEIDKGKTLHEYTIFPNNGSDTKSEVSYTIEYNVEKHKDVFEVPLMVPEFASAGDDKDVHISFQAPEGTKIQKNSFPIVIESNQTSVEKDMANIPVITKYVFAENPTSFHSFSIISFVALFSLFIILIGWAFVEIRRGGVK